MPNAIEFTSFRLKKGVPVPEFMLVSDQFQSGFLAVQKGYISRKLLSKDELWADLVVWESMEDFQNAMAAAAGNAAAAAYLSSINCSAKGSFLHLFSVEKEY